jgi:hypothetical protein
MTGGGYVISDHRAIDRASGSLADADVVVTQAHALGIRVTLDLTPHQGASAVKNRTRHWQFEPSRTVCCSRSNIPSAFNLE